MVDPAQPRPLASELGAGKAIPSDEELPALLFASAYTEEGYHRQTLTNAQRTGAAPPDIPSLLWICCQRLRPEHALLIGLGHYPNALSADPGTRAEGPLASGTAARMYQVERRIAEGRAEVADGNRTIRSQLAQVARFGRVPPLVHVITPPCPYKDGHRHHGARPGDRQAVHPEVLG